MRYKKFWENFVIGKNFQGENAINIFEVIRKKTKSDEPNIISCMRRKMHGDFPKSFDFRIGRMFANVHITCRQNLRKPFFQSPQSSLMRLLILNSNMQGSKGKFRVQGIKLMVPFKNVTLKLVHITEFKIYILSVDISSVAVTILKTMQIKFYKITVVLRVTFNIYSNFFKTFSYYP